VSASDATIFEGESPSIPQRLLVSPTWGRLHRRALREGRELQPDTVVGEIRIPGGGGRIQLRLLFASRFVGWLAWEGEAVTQGQAVAVVLPSDE
jgi:hypothetical protein